jgi:hypothetical protein
VLGPWCCWLLQQPWQVLLHQHRHRLLEGRWCMRGKQHHWGELLHEHWCLLLHWRRCLGLEEPQGRVLLKQHWCRLWERPSCLGLEEWRLVLIGGGRVRGGPGSGMGARVLRALGVAAVVCRLCPGGGTGAGLRR